MYKSLLFVAVAIAGIFAAPLAMVDNLHAPASHAIAATYSAAPVAAGGIPFQLVIVWSLLGLILLVLSIALVRIVRRPEERVLGWS